MKYSFLFFSLLLLFSCKSKDDASIPCTDLYAYGLQVTVKNAVTNATISEGITVIANDGDYSEELQFGIDSYVGAGERPGSYIITVMGDEYQNYTSQTITVAADECHVIGESIEINLQPI